MTITFGEIKINKTSKKHLLEAIESNWITAGPKVKQFEKLWGDTFGYKHNIAMSSGTDSVVNACMVLYDLGAQIGDEIILPALSFIATANAVRAAGFVPVFVDIKSHTLNINEDKIEEVITQKTKAIIAVHTMGKPCNMIKICGLAKENNLIVIEDACEAHGAIYNETLVGNWGDMACFSFYAAHLICCGEGGMVSTNNENIANILKSTQCHGRPHGELYFNHVRFGLNSKMNDLEASMGIGGIEDFEQIFAERYQNLYILQYNVAYKHPGIFQLSLEGANDINCPHAFSLVLCKKYANTINMKFLTDGLDEAKIQWKRNFGSIPTQHKAFSYMGFELGHFPEAEYVGNYGIHIGCHQYLLPGQLNTINNTIDKIVKKILS